MKLKSVSLLLAASLSLAACGGSGNAGPDEFEVLDRAPLIVPPEANLAPPRPGEPRAQEIDPGQQVFEALFPGKRLKRSKPKSKGEQTLLSQLGRSNADIRSNAGGERTDDVVRKRLILADLLDAKERQHRPDDIEIYRITDNS
ncbi:MAG: hypothetical protein COB37_06780 [Kordiimonadales bacterium]|nr:MAG: hypothetical protein COB37_06780 [Kordiimonadales bacterium]